MAVSSPSRLAPNRSRVSRQLRGTGRGVATPGRGGHAVEHGVAPPGGHAWHPGQCSGQPPLSGVSREQPPSPPSAATLMLPLVLEAAQADSGSRQRHPVSQFSHSRVAPRRRAGRPRRHGAARPHQPRRCRRVGGRVIPPALDHPAGAARTAPATAPLPAALARNTPRRRTYAFSRKFLGLNDLRGLIRPSSASQDRADRGGRSTTTWNCLVSIPRQSRRL